MRRRTSRPRWLYTGLLLGFGLALVPVLEAAAPTGTQSLSPTEIQVGEVATLVVTTAGSEAIEIAPPEVPGLEFTEAGQTSRIQSVNGVTTATASVSYRVSAEQPGVYTIPARVPGAQPVVLTVKPVGGGSSARAPAGAGAPGGTDTEGAAFVRLQVRKHSLYVGESVPVDIEVGLRDGLVASLNGPPSLNGDAFTLNQLPAKPDSREEIIDGKPYTVLTWHSLLSAVKPGSLSLTIETPLTVRLRTPHPGAGLGGPGFEDPFDDPLFQNFFRGQSLFGLQKDITVASAPVSFDVAPLPTEGRPASFSGAVGQFRVTSEISERHATAGDPLTLRLHIEGNGNFDRVSDSMLHDVPGWKTYDPTSRFKSSDDIGFAGEKIFEQPLIATQAGHFELPPVEFSYFDPNSGRYETARTSPESVEITPAPAGSSVAQALRAAPSPSTLPSALEPELRADHLESPGGVRSLRPPDTDPRVLASGAALALATAFATVGVRFSRRRNARRAERRRQAAALATAPLLAAMDRARMCEDAEEFFVAACAFLQRVLAARWRTDPEEVTREAVEARLGPDHELARVFELADEARYARLDVRALDLAHWSRIIRQHAAAST